MLKEMESFLQSKKEKVKRKAPYNKMYKNLTK